MQAIILAGGLGTRLRSAVNDRPKPMALVEGKPFLEYIINRLKYYGIINIIIAAGYMGELIEEHFKDGKKFGVNIKYSYEKIKLGTGGALKKCENIIDEEKILVLNGDTLLECDYEKLINYDKDNDSQFTMVLRKVNDSCRYGTVKINRNNMIQNFMEKESLCKTNYINGGIYIISKRLLMSIPDNVNFSLEKQFVPSCLEKKINILGYIVDKYFIDIGVPEDYYKFIEDVKNGVIK